MGKKKKKKKIDRAELSRAFHDLLCENEEHMGEGAAYLVTCEQMGVDPGDGYSLLCDHPDAITAEPGKQATT